MRLRNGCVPIELETEHRADEIASALHTEMPWMAPATERVWQDMRASVRRGDLGTVIRPLLLVGPRVFDKRGAGQSGPLGSISKPPALHVARQSRAY